MKHKIKNLIPLLLLVTISVACDPVKEIIKAPVRELAPMPDLTVSVKQGSSDLSGQQWAIESLGLNEVWKKHQGSKAVRIALLGTGIDYNHEDLKANVAHNIVELSKINPLTNTPNNNQDDSNDGLIDNFVGWDYVNNHGLAYDGYGFDTAMAGIIGASHDNNTGVKGVMSKVSLIPVRYIDSNGKTNIPLFSMALKYATNFKPHIVLLNLANIDFTKANDDDNRKIREAEMKAIKKHLDHLQSSGIPIVIGAGNSGKIFASTNELQKMLLNYRNIIVVTSIEQSFKKPTLANYGMMTVHTSAPGVDILTTAKDNKYEKVSSTQAAAAYVTGALGLAISIYDGQKSFEHLFKALLSSEGSEERTELLEYSLGRNTLNIAKFLEALEQTR